MKPTQLKMKNNWFLIKQLDTLEKTQSGIILQKPKYNRYAEVVASENPELPVGSHIITTIGNGTHIKYKNIQYEMIHYSDILAKIDN